MNNRYCARIYREIQQLLIREEATRAVPQFRSGSEASGRKDAGAPKVVRAAVAQYGFKSSDSDLPMNLTRFQEVNSALYRIFKYESADYSVPANFRILSCQNIEKRKNRFLHTKISHSMKRNMSIPNSQSIQNLPRFIFHQLCMVSECHLS